MQTAYVKAINSDGQRALESVCVTRRRRVLVCQAYKLEMACQGTEGSFGEQTNVQLTCKTMDENANKRLLRRWLSLWQPLRQSCSLPDSADDDTEPHCSNIRIGDSVHTVVNTACPLLLNSYANTTYCHTDGQQHQQTVQFIDASRLDDPEDCFSFSSAISQKEIDSKRQSQDGPCHRGKELLALALAISRWR